MSLMYVLHFKFLLWCFLTQVTGFLFFAETELDSGNDIVRNLGSSNASNMHMTQIEGLKLLMLVILGKKLHNRKERRFFNLMTY